MVKLSDVFEHRVTNVWNALPLWLLSSATLKTISLLISLRWHMQISHLYMHIGKI